MYYVVCDVMQDERERVEIRAAKKNCETTKRWGCIRSVNQKAIEIHYRQSPRCKISY